jgi:hypothetical protein
VTLRPLAICSTLLRTLGAVCHSYLSLVVAVLTAIGAAGSCPIQQPGPDRSIHLLGRRRSSIIAICSHCIPFWDLKTIYITAAPFL